MRRPATRVSRATGAGGDGATAEGPRSASLFRLAAAGLALMLAAGGLGVRASTGAMGPVAPHNLSPLNRAAAQVERAATVAEAAKPAAQRAGLWTLNAALDRLQRFPASRGLPGLAPARRALVAPRVKPPARRRALKAVHACAAGLLAALDEPAVPGRLIRTAREHATLILARPEFQAPHARHWPPWLQRIGDRVERALERILERLGRLLSRAFGAAGGGRDWWFWLSRLLTLAAVSTALVLLASAAARQLARRVRRADAARPEPARSGIRPAEALLAEADERCRAGDYRAALERAFVATLIFLHRLGALKYDPRRTNWEALATLESRVPLDDRRRLQQASNLFDYTWYGDRPCGESEYRSAASALAQVRATAEDAMGGAAE